MAQTTKRCPHCGQDNRAAATFCTGCGNRFDGGAPGGPAPQTAPQAPHTAPPVPGPAPSAGKRSRTVPIVLGLVVVAALVVFLLTRGGEQQVGTLTTPGPTVAAQPTAAPTPGLPTPPPGAQFFSRINSIALQGETYVVEFETFGYEPRLGGTNKHLHFFWNTVPASQAGVPGSGPWILHPGRPDVAGTSPFTSSEFTVGKRPQGATEICVLVANSDHSVLLNTGNCIRIP